MNNSFAELLLNADFVELDHKEDFGSTLAGVFYCKRFSEENKHEYLSLVYYRGTFVEAIYERFLKKKNTRGKVSGRSSSELQKDGIVPVEVGILRSFDDLKTRLGK